MKNMFTRSLLMASLSFGSMSLTGCTSEDWAFGAGVVIGVIIGDSDHHHHHERPSRYPDRRRNRHGHNNIYALNLMNSPKDNLSLAEKTAIHFDLTDEQGAILADALMAAKNNDFSLLYDLGLERKDLELMAQGENPRVSALEAIAAHLNMDLGDTHNLIQDIKFDLQKAL